MASITSKKRASGIVYYIIYNQTDEKGKRNQIWIRCNSRQDAYLLLPEVEEYERNNLLYPVPLENKLYRIGTVAEKAPADYGRIMILKQLLIEYMEQHGRRFMVVYHMVECRKPGYVVFTNERENSRRLSESDILDLIYIARMIEITSSDR